MRTGGIGVILVAALAALAGCATPEAAPGAARESEPLDTALVPTPDAAGDAAAGIAPVWSVGDAWSITSFNDGQEERTVLVVTAAGSDSYTLGTASEQLAAYDAMFDISYLGKIRAADLAGHQGGEPVKYFDFPLADGKTWTAKWDGLEVALTATRSARGFDIVGTVDGEPYVVYDYTPAMKWLSRMEFVQNGYGISVDRFEPGWTGSLVTATAELVHEVAPAGPVATTGSGAFTIAEGQSFALVTLAGGGTQWQRVFSLIDPTGQPYPTTTIQNVEGEFMGPRWIHQQERIPATPGEWHIVMEGAHDPSGGFFLTVHQIAIETIPFVGA